MDTSSSTMNRNIADMASTEGTNGVGHLHTVQHGASHVMPDRLQAAASATDSLLSFNQDNLAAAIRSGHALATGAQELQRNMAAATQSSFDDIRAAMTALAAARSLKDLMDVQANVLRSTMDKAFMRSAQIAGGSFKVAQQTLEPISARVTSAAKSFTPTA